MFRQLQVPLLCRVMEHAIQSASWVPIAGAKLLIVTMRTSAVTMGLSTGPSPQACRVISVCTPSDAV